MPQLPLTGRGLWITALIAPPLAFVALFIVYPIIAAFAYGRFSCERRCGHHLLRPQGPARHARPRWPDPDHPRRQHRRDARAFSAFKSTQQIFSAPFGPPDFTNVENFTRIWTQTNFLRYLANSFIVTGASMALILTLGTMAAYAIARYEFFGATFILMFFLRA